jgi:hypothetical protein
VLGLGVGLGEAVALLDGEGLALDSTPEGTEAIPNKKNTAMPKMPIPNNVVKSFLAFLIFAFRR